MAFSRMINIIVHLSIIHKICIQLWILSKYNLQIFILLIIDLIFLLKSHDFQSLIYFISLLANISDHSRCRIKVLLFLCIRLVPARFLDTYEFLLFLYIIKAVIRLSFETMISILLAAFFCVFVDCNNAFLGWR